uniref:Uncharacterized protein n=1 Tax=Cajanus cajan TaxID=3821 RepID=A0A151UHR4_CAJCA
MAPLRIDDKRVKQLRGKEIPLVKVILGGNIKENATWELESKMRGTYPYLFSGKFWGQNFKKAGGRVVTPQFS